MSETSSDQTGEDARYEEFVRHFARHEGELRRFLASFIPSWGEVDELLQQTAIVIWKKFDQFQPGTDFMKWACVVARFEALSFRRKSARDRLVFREDVLELMAEEAAEEMEGRKKEHEALETCLKAMPERQRQFVTLAYTPGIKIQDLATEAGSTPAAFYMRLKRLRSNLMKCVETKTLNTGHA